MTHALLRSWSPPQTKEHVVCIVIFLLYRMHLRAAGCLAAEWCFADVKIHLHGIPTCRSSF